MEAIQNKEMRGIKGWLLFFVILFILFAIGALIGAFGPIILSSLETVLGETAPSKSTSVYVTSILSAVLFLFYLFIVIGILTWKRYSKNLAIFSIWFSFLVSLINLIVGYLNLPTAINKLAGMDNAEFLISLAKTQFYTSIVTTVIFGVGWGIVITLYFIKSERVKNTLIR